MSKFKLPKIKFKLSLKRILILVLILAAASEAFGLYYAIYAAVALPPKPDGEEAVPPVNFDLEKYSKIKDLVEQRKHYEVPKYSLSVSTTTASTTIILGRCTLGVARTEAI